MQNKGQPMPMEAPPTLQNPVWKEVIPPARMQIRDMVRAKLANKPISPAAGLADRRCGAGIQRIAPESFTSPRFESRWSGVVRLDLDQ